MDDIKEMIKQTYCDLQKLDILPTKDNMSILMNALSTLETCFSLMTKARVINSEEKKEEPEDGNVHIESES